MELVDRVSSHCSNADSSLHSGTLTPASFRKASKEINSYPVGTPTSLLSRSKTTLGIIREKSSNSVRTNHSRKSSEESKHENNKKPVLIKASQLDTIEDALLPKDPSEGKIGGCLRAYAYRLLEHPGATNCTKFSVLRPYTAPSNASQTPPFPIRPKTTKPRKIAEIEYALKWDLKEDIEQNMISENFDTPVKEKKRTSMSPRSITSSHSDDSGVALPKKAWEEHGIDKNDLRLKLESLREMEDKSSSAKTIEICDIESGYNTPASSCSKISLPTVKSRISPNLGIINKSLESSIKSLSNRCKSVERISIDSKALVKQTVDATSTSPEDTKIESEIPVIDPLEIRETTDSVFHKVPLRSAVSNISEMKEDKPRELATSATQTDFNISIDSQTPVSKVKLKVSLKIDLFIIKKTTHIIFYIVVKVIRILMNSIYFSLFKNIRFRVTYLF